MASVVKDVNSKVALGLLLRKDGEGVVGESPTMELRRLSDDKYLDFSAVGDPYWVSTGGQRTMVLPMSSWCDGLYEWIFDQAVYDADQVDNYIAVYVNTGENATVAVETVAFQKPPSEEIISDAHSFDFPDSPNYEAGDGNAWEYVSNSDGDKIWKRQLWYRDAAGDLQALLENMPVGIPNNKPVITGTWTRVT